MLLISKTVIEFAKMETSCLSREQLLNTGTVLEKAAGFSPQPAGLHQGPTVHGAQHQLPETQQ